MAQGGGAPTSDNNLIYSIQRTYIINRVIMHNALALTCNQRIDVPVIEPVTNVIPVVYDLPRTVVPCIELKMLNMPLEGMNLAFETNEGETVLPVKINSGRQEPSKNPYSYERWVLALPRGTTGIKSCKVLGYNGEIIYHNFTFGIMPPPYNYDNALFGYLSYGVDKNSKDISKLREKVNSLMLSTQPFAFWSEELPKGQGKQTINIAENTPFYETRFDYSSSPETTIHKPKITLRGGDGIDFVYTLSLDRPLTVVSIDLLTGVITAYDEDTGEILKQFKLGSPYNGFTKFSFENFDDIDNDSLTVKMKEVSVI